MREVIVVASTWVLDPDKDAKLVMNIKTKKLTRVAPFDSNQRCVSITLDQDSARLLKSVLDPDLCSKFGFTDRANKLISGITEHTQESC